ncbi:MAG TPA: CAP domain-containing protein, partial [Prosthecobacter sp.]|nr:CAP domain-containing protein [Prosthecobacter sp.]
MRLALVMLLWTAFAGAQEAEVRTAPAAPTPPPILRRAAAPVPQGMAAAQPQGAPLPLYSIGQPTDEEQYYLELINRARANPTAEGVRLAATTDPDVTGAYDAFNVDLNLMKNEFSALAVRPPLAMNEDLMQAARAHSQDMFTNVFQGHGSTNGDDLGDRATDAGYNFGSLGENVFSFAESVFHGHAGFEVDWGGGGTGGMQAGRGHRMNIHGTFREVGIGVVKGTKTAGATTVGPQLVTQDFGTAQGATPLVTGVAYYDLNGNSFYDMGEGIGGLTVTVDGASVQAVTANTGGYAVPVPATNTSRAVTFSGLGVNSGGTATIAALANAKVDFAPAYVPPTVTGAASASTAGPSTYNFTVVGGAVSYEWRRATAAAAVTDTAANLSRVTVVKTGSYSELLSGRYHLAHATPPTTQSITYNGVFRASNGASV